MLRRRRRRRRRCFRRSKTRFNMNRLDFRCGIRLVLEPLLGANARECRLVSGVSYHRWNGNFGISQAAHLHTGHLDSGAQVIGVPLFTIGLGSRVHWFREILLQLSTGWFEGVGHEDEGAARVSIRCRDRRQGVGTRNRADGNLDRHSHYSGSLISSPYFGFFPCISQDEMRMASREKEDCRTSKRPS